jgi:superfamily II DNA or RNA helicase
MLFPEPPDVLSSLPPADRVIAELKALVGQQPLAKGVFFEIVRGVKATAPDGKAWSTPKVNDSVERLVKKRVLGADGAIAPGWCEPLTLRVVGRPDGRALAAAVRAAAPKSWREKQSYQSWHTADPSGDVDLARAVRLMALANDAAEVERLIGIAERAPMKDDDDVAVGSLLLRGCPADIGFIDALKPALRDRVVSAHVELLIAEGLIDGHVEAMIEALRTRDWDWAAAPRLDRALMRLDLMAERPEAARVRVGRVRARDPVAALAAEAALEFLTGSTIASLPTFREALKQYRKAAGRRKVALPQEFGLYHLLALFATGDANLHAEIAALLDIVAIPGSVIGSAFLGLFELVSGRDNVAKQWVNRLAGPSRSSDEPEAPMETAVATLALTVVDGAKLASREAKDRRAIERWGGQARLAARIVALAHAHVSSNPPPWRETLASYGPGYDRQFLDIVPIRPTWERALDKLQAFLVPPAATKIEAPTKSRRLIFLFDAATSEITALEQTSKRDGWNSGRPVPLSRLYKRDPKLDYLTPEDQKVLNAIKSRYERYFDGALEFDRIRGALALIGHPRVFDANAPARQIEVIGYPLELVVREDGDGIRIDLSHRADEPKVFVEMETPTRWRVIETTPATVELGTILGPKGLKTPKQARERVIALVKSDNPRLLVRSELAGAATEVADGDTSPILRITPEDGDFTIHALVRPLGDDGPAYVPGVGSHSVLVPSGGAHRRINRDLKAETAALEAVAEACPTLASWRENDTTWRIEALDAALETLQQLHDFTGPLRLEWPQGAEIKPTRNVGASALSLNISSGRDWFEVTGSIAIDEGLVLDMAELLARLSAAPGRFVALDDGRYFALTEDLRRRLDAFAAVTESAKSGRRIGAAGAGAVEDLVNAAGAVRADGRWSELIDKLALAQHYQPELPPGLDADLRDYQLQGFTWLARLSRLGLGACLADDMGLGKTVQTLALLLHDAAKGPSLVVTPTSVCHNWMLEAARFTPALRVRMLAGASDRTALVEALVPGDVLVASYGLLHTEADLLASRRFAVAVFDEAQNLKNADTRRAQASKRIEADFRLALSGTPVENRLEELWSLYDTVTPGLLGSRESFHRRFASPIEKGFGGHARQALKTLVRPYLLRRTKAAVLAELPSRTEITLEIEPGDEERAFYEALRRKALDALGTAVGTGGQQRIRILAEIMRLRRAACHPALIDAGTELQSAKLAALLDLTAELIANRHRALVFSQFTGHLDLVEAALKAEGVRLLRLDGSTPVKERARRVEAFQSGEGELFLISLKAGGAGLNLTGADYVIHLDPWWNPAVEDQATDRAHRIGQTLPVTVYRLVRKDSIEEKILALHATKRALSADFLDGADQAGALGEEELMALIRG